MVVSRSRINIFLLLFFSLFFLLGFSSFSTAYIIRGNIEDIYLVRPSNTFIDTSYYPPEYLELEDLVFYTCLEEDNLTVHSSVICRDDNSFDDVTVYKWSDRNCFMANYDLSLHECSNVLIKSTYELGDETVSLEQEIKVNRLTSVMDHIENSQYSDGGWKDAMETAYGLWAMSYFPYIYKKEIEMGLEWLKLYRDNDNKCWPKNGCSPFQTANILGILTLAGFNDSLRIMHDGLLWLEKNQNFYSPSDVWTVNVTPYFLDSECLVSYNNNNMTVNISLGSSYDYSFTPSFDADLYVICTEPVKVRLVTQDNEEVLYYEGDNMTYSTPGAGWANGDRWGNSDVQTTLWAVLTNIPQERRDAAVAWLTKELHLEGNKGKYVGTSKNVSNAALYLFAINRSPVSSSDYSVNYSRQDVLDWLRFKQNNDGSWGSGNVSYRVVPTGNSVLSLLNIGFNRSNEVVEDAEEWISENELEYGWNTTRQNAYSFYVLKNNARPFLKSVPRILIMNAPSKVLELYNPTTYDLTALDFEFSDNLKDKLEMETQDGISAYSYIRLTVRRLSMDNPDTYGYLYISNSGLNISKIPVLLVSTPAINITPSKSVKVFGTKGKVPFNIVKTGDTFKCELSWDDPDISSPGRFTFVNEKSVSVNVKFTKAERFEKSYKGSFFCTVQDKTFLVPFSVDIDRYPSYPIEVSPERIYVNDTQDVSFLVKNLLDESVDVTAKFSKSEDFFDIEKTSFVLNPSQVKNITVYNVIPPGFNVTSRNTIEVAAIGQKESIKFVVDVKSPPPKKLSPLVFWSVMILAVLLVGVGGYFAYRYRDKILALLRPGKKIEDVRDRIRALEEQGMQLAIKNYIRMLRFQGKKDSEIRERLLEEGFKEEEIDKVFKQV